MITDPNSCQYPLIYYPEQNHEAISCHVRYSHEIDFSFLLKFKWGCCSHLYAPRISKVIVRKLFLSVGRIKRTISSIFLLVVRVEIDSITAKPYIPQKSWFQWICSKFFGLWHGHNYFWPPWLWRLLEAKNVIASAHFGTQLNVRFIPQCHFCLPKEIKSNPNVHQ